MWIPVERLRFSLRFGGSRRPFITLSAWSSAPALGALRRKAKHCVVDLISMVDTDITMRYNQLASSCFAFSSSATSGATAALRNSAISLGDLNTVDNSNLSLSFCRSSSALDDLMLCRNVRASWEICRTDKSRSGPKSCRTY